VKVGDRVLFGKWSGTEVKIDDQELLIMKESDLMGIIDEPVPKRRPRNPNKLKSSSFAACGPCRSRRYDDKS
jgi:hypothetical protein